MMQAALSRFLTSQAILFAVCSVTAGQTGQVLVVDDDGGPGVEFTALEDAIDAAVDGDILLVHPGLYLPINGSSFPFGATSVYEVDQKSIVMVAPNGADLYRDSSLAAWNVKNLTAAQNFSMRGFTFKNENSVSFMSFDNNAGIVWMEDIDGSTHSVDIQGTRAILERFVAPPQFGFGPEPTQAVNSEVHAHGSTFETPSEFQGGIHGSQGMFIPGPPAIELTDSFLLAYGCEITSTEDMPGLPGIVDLDVQGTSEAILLDSPASFTGNPPTVLPGVARTYVADPTVTEGGFLTHTFEGPPGENAFLLISSQPAAIYLPRFRGSLLVGPLIIPVRFLGTIPASGTLQVSVPIPFLPVGVDGTTIYVQAAYRSPTGRITLGGGSMVVILDEAL